MFDVLITGKTHTQFPPFGFQTFYFNELQAAADTLGISLFYIDPLEQIIGNALLQGYINNNGSWERATAQLPKLVYYRFSSTDSKELAMAEKFKQYCLEKKVLFANPLSLVETLNDKWVFHQFLFRNNKADIPTVIAKELKEANLKKWLLAHEAAYLKPINASNGRGVCQIRFRDGQYSSITATGVETFDFAGFQQFFEKFPAHIIQPAIFPVSLNNPPFDIRVLVQHTGDTYQVSGMGIRLGKKDSKISNLKGGGVGVAMEELHTLLPPKTDTALLIKKIKIKCLSLSDVMHKKWGDFCEIAFDILIDKNKQPLVLEANANPGRWLFNKIADNYFEATDEREKMLEKKYRAMRKKSVMLPIKFLKTRVHK